MAIRVAVGEDSLIVREGVHMLLAVDPAVEIVAAVGDVDSLRDAFEHHRPEGKSNMAIAESLVLTKRAVEKHINSIFLKLGLAYADDVSKRVKAALMFLFDADGVAAANPAK